MLVARKMVQMNHFVYPNIEKFLAMSPDLIILEIGFGPGIGVAYFASKYHAKVDGIDYSPLMVKTAIRRNKKAVAAGQVRLQYGNFLEHTISPQTYDRVFFANVTYFWQDLQLPFQKIFHALKPNGKIAFYMSNPQILNEKGIGKTEFFRPHEDKDVCSVLENCGFTQVRANKILDESGNFLIIEATKPGA